MNALLSESIKLFISTPRFNEEKLLKRDAAYPKLSIITPSYNQAAFLERAILSVLNQNYPNLEYIVIDGGSIDGSINIIKKYERYLSFWISEPDKGQSDALNKGFKMVTGDLIAWQNSDDIYLPGALQRVAQEYIKKKKSDVFFGNVYLIDAADNILREMRFHSFSTEHLIYYDWNLSSQAVFWKRDVFQIAGYLSDYDVLFDWEWFIRLGRMGFRFSFIHNFLGAYRLHENSKLAVVKNRALTKRKILENYGVKYISEEEFKKTYYKRRLYYQTIKFVKHFSQMDIGYISFILRNRCNPK